MDRRSHRHAVRKYADDRGVALVEFAMVLLPLLLLLGGILEVGPAYRDSLRFEQATRTAARVAANLTNDDQADRESLRALNSVLDSDSLDMVEYIVIYELDASGDMPSTCHVASTWVCNRYEPDQLADLDDDASWGCGPAAHDRHWCPTSRAPELTAPVDLGVFVKARRDWTTGLIPGDGVELENETVMRLDPLNR